MDYTQLHIHHTPEGRMRVATPDRCYLFARPVWAAPLSRPGEYLALLDQDGAEIIMLPTLNVLSPEARAAVERELRQRYVQAQVLKLESVTPQHGATYFAAVTDRGRREFVMQQLHDNAIWFSPTHVLLLDVDGNRFEIPDTSRLDEASQKFVKETF